MFVPHLRQELSLATPTVLDSRKGSEPPFLINRSPKATVKFLAG